MGNRGSGHALSPSPDIPSPMSASSHQPVWIAKTIPGATATDEATSPAAVDRDWLPLGQPWQEPARDPGFQAGWARVRWQETALHYDLVFMGAGARNAAGRLNERTWELGDVGEIFVQTGSGPGYLEVHVTPENMRLQLLWSADGLARVRRKAATLEEFMIATPGWVESQTRVGTAFWSVHVAIPAARFGVARLHAGQLPRTAVCRYDYRSSEPVLSSTAPLPVPFFHHRDGWHSLLLAD